MASLDALRIALLTLPPSLPSGASYYNFDGWTPDSDAIDTYGAECSAFNAHLENVFGLRANGPIRFEERGPGIDSIVDVFTRYLTGDFAEKLLLEKWVVDLTEAAQAMATATDVVQPKRTTKPSDAQKRPAEWQELVDKAAVTRKRQKQEADLTKERNAKLIAETEQRCNWKLGLADLVDDVDQVKLYTGGRRGYAIVDELVILCHSTKTGDARVRCSAKGCEQSWSKRNPQRVFEHAIADCRFTDRNLKERVAEASAKLSLGRKVADLDSQVSSLETSESVGAFWPSSQNSIVSVVQSEGRKAKQTRFDLRVVNLVCASQIPPYVVDSPEFHSMIEEANVLLKPKSASYLASAQIPMESIRIRTENVKLLQTHRNLTISFDGGTAIGPRSYTTIHVTTPSPREAYLLEGVEASGTSHTGKYYFDELVKIIEEVGPAAFSGVTCDSTGNTSLARQMLHERFPTIIVMPDPCHQLHNAVKDLCRLDYFAECIVQVYAIGRYFSKSKKAAHHLVVTLGHMGIQGMLKKNSRTRFAGIHDSCSSTRLCLPAIDSVVAKGVIEIKKDHKLAFMKNVAAYNKFKVKLDQLVKLTEPFAKAIKCLESGESNPSDVFIFNLAVMAVLRQLFDNNKRELGLPDDVVAKVQTSASARYYSLILASDREIYLSTFFLHPGYRSAHILRRNNLNPSSSSIVLRPQHPTPSLPDSDLRQSIPSFEKIGLFLKKTLCEELKAGTIPAARNYTDGQSIVDAFKSQFVTYARGEHPFVCPPLSHPAALCALDFWNGLLKHPDACFLAHVAVKLFSLVPNSMSEERTVSCFTKLNNKTRARQKVSTLVHMTRIRQHLMRKREGRTCKKTKPVLRFQDLSDSLLSSRPTNELAKPKLSTPKHPAVGVVGTHQTILETSDNTDDSSDDEGEIDSVDGDVEPILEGAELFDAEIDYGIDLHNPFLLDVLSEKPVEGAQVSKSSHTEQLAKQTRAEKSAKRDVSAIDLSNF